MLTSEAHLHLSQSQVDGTFPNFTLEKKKQR